MANIVAGRFETQTEADRVLEALGAAGFASDEYTCFYVNPPGQHAQYPIGGDAHHDEGTKESGKKAAAAAAIGGVTGLALGTATGLALGEPGFTAAGAIAGAGIGGYVGSLAGGLAGSRGGDASQSTAEEPVERADGVMVAVHVDDTGATQRAIQLMRDHGALEVEEADGTWLDGTWSDFDPMRQPEHIARG
jgi:hypothetical protein